MSGYLPRSAWNARPARPGPGRLDPDLVEGIAFHWPGSTSSRPLSREAIPRAIRAWQDFHLDGRGWSDIAYQVAVDNYGRKWILRGLDRQSGANGDTDVNRRYAAVLLILVQGEKPSPAMVEAVRQVVDDLRGLYPGADRLVGHGEIRPGGGTECPGPAALDAIHSGAFAPPRKDPEPMSNLLQLWSRRWKGRGRTLRRIEAKIDALAAAVDRLS